MSGGGAPPPKEAGAGTGQFGPAHADQLLLGQAAQLEAATGAHLQHTVHDLEPLTRYSMRVIAVNALGPSRPSVALSLRTEEEGECWGAAGQR